MRLKLFERRGWDVGVGRVFSVFDNKEDAEILNLIPNSNNFFIWVDSKPFPVEFDVVLATSIADEQRNAQESARSAISSNTDNQ
jgi:hypothetical protein